MHRFNRCAYGFLCRAGWSTLADEILKRGTVTAKSRCGDTDETLWVDCERDFFNFQCRHPVSIECTNQCAHARADHQIRLDAVSASIIATEIILEVSRAKTRCGSVRHTEFPSLDQELTTAYCPILLTDKALRRILAKLVAVAGAGHLVLTLCAPCLMARARPQSWRAAALNGS